MSKAKYDTREAWLIAAAEVINGWIAEKTDLTPAKKTQVSVGFPRRERGGKIIGQCYGGKSGGGVQNVYVSPRLGTATQALPVLAHELIHAADDCESGHQGAFRKAWKALGFTGKPTASEPGPDLKQACRELAGELGPYPHTKLVPVDGPGKPQSTRMLKVECVACGCVIRMTNKWIEEAGTPTCGCGEDMELAA